MRAKLLAVVILLSFSGMFVQPAFGQTKPIISPKPTAKPSTTPARQEPVGVPTTTPSPSTSEFVLTAGPGKFPPGSIFHFLDNWIDGFKLALKPNFEAKLTKRMDISEKKMMQMKIAVHQHKTKNLSTAVKEYKSQMEAINDMIKDKNLNEPTRIRMLNRVRDQEKSYDFLFSLAYNDMLATLESATSQLQMVKSSIH